MDLGGDVQEIKTEVEIATLWEQAKIVYPKEDTAHYLKLTAWLCVFYLLFHLVVHLICVNVSDRYIKMKRSKRGEYRAYVISPVHSVLSVSFSVLAMFFVCPGDETVFNSEECLDTPRYLHIWGIVNSSSYFIIDTFNTVALIREFSTYDYQMIGHHIIAVFTFYGTLVFMNFTTVFGVMLLFVELSTTYICIRWLLYTHRLHRTCCQTVNTIVCFFTFLFGRLIFQVFILFAYGYPLLIKMFDEEEMPWWKVALIVEMALSISVSALMNAYWMYLIIHQVIRMARRSQQGLDPTSETSGINDEDPEKDYADDEQDARRTKRRTRYDSEGEGAEPSMDSDEHERRPLISRKRRRDRRDNRANTDSSDPDLSAGEVRSRQARRGPHI